MEKIPTLFIRDPADMSRVLPEINHRCQWVADGEGTATRKYDGTCVWFDGDAWWSRREVKPNKAFPPGFQYVTYDPVTGKTIGWEPIEQSPFAKFHAEAVAAHATNFGWLRFDPGSYELIGVKINGNPERIDPEFGHQLMSHAHAEELFDVPRDFAGLAGWLADCEFEGIVWHHPDGRMAMLKKRDMR